jgi:hypothetical protein
MEKRNHFPFVEQIHQTGPTHEAYPARHSFPLYRRYQVDPGCRCGPPVSGCLSTQARLSTCFFHQIRLLTRAPPRRCCTHSVALVTYCHCCRAASPTHGASGRLVSLSVASPTHGASGRLVSLSVVKLFPPLPAPATTPLSHRGARG